MILFTEMGIKIIKNLAMATFRSSRGINEYTCIVHISRLTVMQFQERLLCKENSTNTFTVLKPKHGFFLI